MKQIKAFIFRDKDSDKNVTVVLQDGGVASAYNPDTYYRTDYYQDRIKPDSSLDTVWDELSEGKMYGIGWDGKEAELKEKSDEGLVDDMIQWLYISTEPFEIVKVEMGELTEETFNKVKQQLIFD